MSNPHVEALPAAPSSRQCYTLSPSIHVDLSESVSVLDGSSRGLYDAWQLYHT